MLFCLNQRPRRRRDRERRQSYPRGRLACGGSWPGEDVWVVGRRWLICSLRWFLGECIFCLKAIFSLFCVILICCARNPNKPEFVWDARELPPRGASSNGYLFVAKVIS